jgi:hypothetical protein
LVWDDIGTPFLVTFVWKRILFGKTINSFVKKMFLISLTTNLNFAIQAFRKDISFSSYSISNKNRIIREPTEDDFGFLVTFGIYVGIAVSQSMNLHQFGSLLNKVK